MKFRPLVCFRTHFRFAALALLALPAIASAQSDQFAFKELPLGGLRADAIATDRFTCALVGSPTADFTCTLKNGVSETYAGAPARFISLDYYGNTLSSIWISLSSADFDQVLGAMTEKYGKPEVERVLVKNGIGQQLENTIATWKTSNSLATLSQYDSKITTSSLTFRLNSVVEEFTKRRKAAATKNVKDM